MDAQADTLAKIRDEDEFGAYHGMHWPTFFIANVANRHTRNMTNNLRQFGLIPPIWRVLSFLWDHEELSIGHLADVCGIERTNLSKVVDRMTGDGLVARVSDPRDGRTTIVRMTGEGEALFRRVDRHRLARRERRRLLRKRGRRVHRLSQTHPGKSQQRRGDRQPVTAKDRIRFE